MRRQVVVTGLGAVTPLGNDVPTLWEGLLAGRSGVGPITLFDPSQLEVRIAAEVRDFDPMALFGRREARRNDRFTLFALEAARQVSARVVRLLPHPADADPHGLAWRQRPGQGQAVEGLRLLQVCGSQASRRVTHARLHGNGSDLQDRQ